MSEPLVELVTEENSGLYGVVWKGRQKNPDRAVAVKIVNPAYGMTFDAIQHANGFVAAGAHPNIVEVHFVTKVVHAETQESVDAVVLEWLEGVTLAERLKGPLLAIEEARGICKV